MVVADRRKELRAPTTLTYASPRVEADGIAVGAP